MQQFTPATAQELAEILGSAAAKSQSIQVIGKNSKRSMGGPILPSETQISTVNLKRVLKYERDDLTISVEAGMPLSALQQLLTENGQMIALDPPFGAETTVGGLLATNVSGPMRRGYGTARDLVIGMTFATLEGKLVKTGGMVVKNVAGLDMAKVMIGSFGTLAVIASANFRVHPLPPETRTFLFTQRDSESALDLRDSIVRGVLQPMALELITPPAAARLNLKDYVLAVRAGGSRTVLARYASALSGSDELAGTDEMDFWSSVREFPVEFMKRQPNGVVLRISTTLNGLRPLLKMISGAAIARAASGVAYLCLTNWEQVAQFWNAAAEHGWNAVVEMAGDEARNSHPLWLISKDDANVKAFGMMERIKGMFDPNRLLNRSRLYGRI